MPDETLGPVGEPGQVGPVGPDIVETGPISVVIVHGAVVVVEEPKPDASMLAAVANKAEIERRLALAKERGHGVFVVNEARVEGCCNDL